jgi:hypothetical protein
MDPVRRRDAENDRIARLILGSGNEYSGAPNLTPDGYELYLEAGINDWEACRR